MSTTTLNGRRILVVGASAGIGKATGTAAAAEGARVAFAARRLDRLEEIVADLDGCVAVPCDASDPESATAAVDTAAAALGGLDAVVYVAGASPLGMLDEVEPDFWKDLFALNVFGAAAVAKAAAPHLRESGGRLVFISSNATERPWPGMVSYAASKAALDAFISGWNNEHPDIGATRVVVGPTMTEMALGWDPELGGRLRPRWVGEGYLAASPAVQEPDDVADAICHALRSSTRITDVRVVPPGV